MGLTANYVITTDGNSIFWGPAPSGLPSVVAGADLTGQTAAVASVVAYTTSADGTYRVAVYLTVTAVTLDVIQVKVTYTDETNTSRTQAFFPTGVTCANVSTVGAFAFAPINIRGKSGTTITIATTLVTGSGTIAYDVGATIEQLR